MYIRHFSTVSRHFGAETKTWANVDNVGGGDAWEWWKSGMVEYSVVHGMVE